MSQRKFNLSETVVLDKCSRVGKITLTEAVTSVTFLKAYLPQTLLSKIRFVRQM